MFFSKKWMQKMSGDRISNESIDEEQRAYQKDNPHEEQLMSVFKAAGIEYGRIDYGVCNGRVQIWEINTNPWIVTTGHMEQEDRQAYHEMFLEKILSVFRQIGAVELNPPVSFRLPPSAIARYEIAKARRLGSKYTKKKIRAWLRSKLKPGA